MLVTGFCNICGRESEDVCHALFSCPHAHNLWETMRQSWLLPSDLDFHQPLEDWFKHVLIHIPNQMIDQTLLVASRVWYARNEVTHDKPLPSCVSSERFLLSYEKIVSDCKELSVEKIVKGKQPLVRSIVPRTSAPTRVVH
jgi:hypothetical protein